MRIQPTSKSERSRYGDHVVRVVCGTVIAPTTDTMGRLQNRIPFRVQIATAAPDNGYGRTAYLLCNSPDQKRKAEIAIEGEDGIQRLIDNLRWFVALHSHIYYDLGEAVVSDEAWDRKARKLGNLQATHSPHAGSWFNEEFDGFTGDTGYHLPTTPALEEQAERLIEKQDRDDESQSC